MRLYLITAIMIVGLFSQTTEGMPERFEYEQSQFQAFYFFNSINIDSSLIDADDWVAAFNGDVCVGARLWGDCGGQTCDIPANGFDQAFLPEQTAGYMEMGDIPSFQIYDSSENTYYYTHSNEGIDPWMNGSMFFLDELQSMGIVPIYGCNDEQACNTCDNGCNTNDGSCNYPAENFDCDGNCIADIDCNGECAGSATLDNCGTCDDDNGNDCQQDCAGDWGGSAEEDDCGECNGDNSSCTGCTNSDATNYSGESFIFDDGSCEFYMSYIDDLAAEAGENRVYLTWSEPKVDYENDNGVYLYTIYVNGEYHSDTNTPGATIYDLEANVEYSFYVDFTHEYGTGGSESTVYATPLEPAGLPVWRLQLVAEIDSYDQFENTGNPDWLLRDDQNFIGAATDASWGYDENHDIPEPPTGPSNYISLFFDHPEWDTDFWGAHFTEDIVSDNDDFFSTNLTVWNGTIESDVPGHTTITPSIDIGPIPSNYEMYIELDGNFTRINHEGGTEPVTFYMDGSGQHNFSIYIGNIVPQAPDNLTAVGEFDGIALNWDSDHDNGEDLNDIGDRYPATRWHVYRDDEPSDPNSNNGAPGNGPGGCGGEKSLLSHNHFGYDGLDFTDFYDMGVNGDGSPIYPEYEEEGLLQESTYSYTITGSNLAGESSEGHTVRTSGGLNTWHDGRDSRITATTLENESPVVILNHTESWNGTNLGEGHYEIPHNFDPDENRIDITIIGFNSYDNDFPYGDAWADVVNDDDEENDDWRLQWTQTGGNDDLQDIVGLNTPSISFTVGNPHENGVKSYTWNLHIETDHPVKTSGECGEWTSELHTHEDDNQISVTIEEEPNADPVASSALGLIRVGDGLSVVTSDDYDMSDFNDYDGNPIDPSGDQVWYAPHDNMGGENPADLWFSADQSYDEDNACEGDVDDGPPACLIDCGLEDLFVAFDNNDADAICIAVASWDSSCYDDCPPEEEVEMIVESCTACLGGIFDCSELFDGGGPSGCEPCDGVDGCGSYFDEGECLDQEGCYWLGWEDGPGCQSEFANCPDGEQSCGDGSTCITQSQMCDGVIDCPEGFYDGAHDECHDGCYEMCEDIGGEELSACENIDGYVDDCSGDGDCCPMSWIGDGFPDCAEQEYDCDLSCFDNDGGDCGDEGNRSSGSKRDSAFRKIDLNSLLSSSNSRDHEGDGCDEQQYTWILTSGTDIGFNYSDENGDGLYNYGEPFSYMGNDAEIYSDLDLGDYIAYGGEQEEIYPCYPDCDPSVVNGHYYTSVNEETGLSKLAYNDFSFSYNGRDMHLSRNGGDEEVYILTMIVTDIYNDSDQTSLIISVRPERNQAPVADEHRLQPHWYIAYDDDNREVFVDAACDGLGASDADNDDLTYDWSYSGPDAISLDEFDSFYLHNGGGDILDATADLGLGAHTFTFIVTDSYGASDTASTSFEILNEPGAVPGNINVQHTDLKYTVIDVSENILPPFQEDCHGEIYNGADFNTARLDLLRDGELIMSWDDQDSDDSGTLTHIDESLDAETDYIYTLRTFNSDQDSQEDDIAEVSDATRTHDRPNVIVDTPNGLEIASIGDLYNVAFTTTQQQYISRIEVFYLRDGENQEDGTDQNGVKQESVTEEDWSSERNINGSANGDSTLSFLISDDSGEEVNYNAKVRVVVHDVGDYNGNNHQSHSDVSNDPFTMAAHTLHHHFSAGWHLFGPALEVYEEELDLVGHLEAPDNMGDWGSEWVAYDVGGNYDGLTLNHGEGYYLAVAHGATMEVRGNPVIGDPVTEGNTVSLDKGWNLISNPLVSKVSKDEFKVDFEGNELSFDDAVDAGWIAPTIYGWFENSYESIERIMPFGGYFVNTSRQLTLKVNPHLFDDNNLFRKVEESIANSSLELRARDISGDGISDFISVGLLENADNEFVYGEDEYDLPREAYTSMGGEYIDLKIGSNLMKDIKSSNYDDFQAWNISIGTQKVDNDIELSWGDVSGFEDDVYIVINDEVTNMLEQTSINISTVIDNVVIVVGDVNAYLNPIPDEFGLSAAYPNPFNPVTNLGLALNEDGLVSMSIFNIRGQVVEVLVDKNMKAGYHNIVWNADGISSGMYFVKVENGTNMAIQKLMLLK